MEQTTHYYPYGGTFASSTTGQPYKYNGKEYNTHNGLNWYDYGARHYDPAIARWTAQDPLAEKYYGWNPYNYCGANPVLRVDSEGKIWETAWDVISIAAGVKNLTDNISQGNYEAALADGAGILVDVAAAVIPFVPGGVSVARTAARVGDTIDDFADAKKFKNSTISVVGKGNNTDFGVNFNGKHDTNSSTSREAFRKAKDQNGVARSAQPDKIIKPNTIEGDQYNLSDKNVKLFEYTNSSGQKVQIRQDKPVIYDDGGKQPAHFNAGLKEDNKLKQHHNYGN